MKDLGYESFIVNSANEAVNKARATADFDLIVIGRNIADADFPFAYSKIRRESDLGGLPTIVVVDKAREKAVKKLVAKDANVAVITEDFFKGDELKAALDKVHKDAKIVKINVNERKIFAGASMDFLWRMAKGEYRGYDISPAVGAVVDQLQNPRMHAVPALEILGRIPGKEIQYRLAGIVSDPKADKLRDAAVMELNRHIHSNGLSLDKKQVAELKIAHKESPEASFLRSQLNVTMSLVDRPGASKTGADISGFRIDVPPPPQPMPKEKEKDEKKDN